MTAEDALELQEVYSHLNSIPHDHSVIVIPNQVQPQWMDLFLNKLMDAINSLLERWVKNSPSLPLSYSLTGKKIVLDLTLLHLGGPTHGSHRRPCLPTTRCFSTTANSNNNNTRQPLLGTDGLRDNEAARISADCLAQVAVPLSFSSFLTSHSHGQPEDYVPTQPAMIHVIELQGSAQTVREKLAKLPSGS
ncbi:hypothetical protein PTTG_25564 [Puccinia triticina 1-1 BBBD Race 1]|uniref:Uncharacterized protein n=1 Tax=Puccinia triticina (isolate 1-1 / race 1 (BBBD)) TaxID=630390 RepID=A0A180H1M6_PUCT1|nr:hypothetical protein PTTG_25564 [Puccinia triticina 1-1 BBBD Race 1]